MEMDKCGECDYTPGRKETLIVHMMWPLSQSNTKLLVTIKRNKPIKYRKLDLGSHGGG